MTGTRQNTSEINIKKGGSNTPFLAHGPLSWPLAITVMIVSIVGILCLYSASVSLGGNVIYKQLFLLVGGYIVMAISACIDVSFYRSRIIVMIMMVGGMALMAFCLVINHGQEIKRSMSVGPISVEPSEILKFASIIFIAFYSQYHKEDLAKQGLKSPYEAKNGLTAACVRFGHRANMWGIFRMIAKHSKDQDFFFDDSFWYHLVLALCVGVPLVLIAVSSHLSAMIIYAIVCLFLLFYCGAKPKYLKAGCLLAIFAVGLYCLFFMSDYQKERFTDWSLVPKDKTQSKNALYAICSGGLTGKGYLNSTEKFGYVAESKNDFIFSIFCEEFGFIGAVILILGFSLLVTLIYKIGKQCEDPFERLTVKGIAVMIATQVMLHICVNTSLSPNTGITLPFFSSGGSALLINFAEMGYVLSVSRNINKTDRKTK